MKIKAFTLMEIIVAMVISSFLFIVGGISYVNSINHSKNFSGRSMLYSAVLEAHRVASVNFTAPLFPSNLQSQLKINNVEFSDGDSNNVNIISYKKVDDSEYIYSVKSGNFCWVVIDKYGNKSKWGYSENSAICNANSWNINDITSTNYNSPTIISGGSQ